MSRFNLRGKLTLTVHACRNLKNRELLGKMDPFCEVRLSNSKEKFKTRVAKDGHTNPVWEQSYIFNLVGKEELLHLVVYNEGTLSNDHLGRCDVDLTKLDLSGEKRWYQLKDRNDFTKVTGECSMSVVWEGVGLPEDSEAFKSHQARLNAAKSPASATSPAATPVSPPVQQQQTPQVQPQQQYNSGSPAPYASAQPNYNQPPPQQYAPPPQQQYASPPPQQYAPQPQYGSQPPQYGSQQPQYGSQYAPPPQPQYAPPPQVYSQAPPVYSAPPMPVAQPVYQAAPQPTIVYQPPQQVYVAPQPTVTYQQPQTVVYQQMPPRGQIIGYWPNGQPRYA